MFLRGLPPTSTADDIAMGRGLEAEPGVAAGAAEVGDRIVSPGRCPVLGILKRAVRVIEKLFVVCGFVREPHPAPVKLADRNAYANEALVRIVRHVQPDRAGELGALLHGYSLTAFAMSLMGIVLLVRTTRTASLVLIQRSCSLVRRAGIISQASPIVSTGRRRPFGVRLNS